MKRIIFCFDGTWQNLSQRFQTNVAKTASAILPKCENGVEQIVYYSEGVGNERGVWPALTAKFGGAFGSGLEDELRQAYQFLCFNFREGDEIYVFGFSRGAFTGRSFCGLINHCGILCRDAMDEEEFMIREYKLKNSKVEKLENKKRNFCHQSNTALVKYLGVWDTVCARGLPEVFKVFRPYNKKYDFHNISLNNNISNARHAVSLDEIRNMFPPEPWSSIEIDQVNKHTKGVNIEQLWFSGDHGNVGGGGNNFIMSNTALLWVWRKALNLGLELKQADLNAVETRTTENSSNSSDEITYSTSFFKGLPYSLGGFRSRAGVTSKRDLHHTALDRIDAKEGYWPKAYPRNITEE